LARRSRRRCSAANYRCRPQGDRGGGGSQVGGRCITDSSTFGVPFDRGARWIHNPETNR
jgi:hypothetical protein